MERGKNVRAESSDEQSPSRRDSQGSKSRTHYIRLILFAKSTVSIYSGANTSAVLRLEDIHECKSPSIRLRCPAAHTLHLRDCSSFRAAEDGQRQPRPR